MLNIVFKLQDPVVLVLLLIIPLMIFVHLKKRNDSKITYSSLNTIKNISQPSSVVFRHILLILRCVAILLIVIALARPQSGSKISEITSDGIDIMLAVDTSGTMQAMDFVIDGERKTRLDVNKKLIKDFIKKRKNDRIGMVVFGTEAYTQCPLTLDYGILSQFIDKTEIGMAGEETAIGSAIGTAVNRLKDLQSKSKVIILLTDGRNNQGQIAPDVAAQIAKTYNIKIYTIGVGTEGAAPFLVDTIFGKQYVYQQVDLDENTLKQIAQETGGMYFRATDTEKLEEIYGEIDKLEKSKAIIKEFYEYNELYAYFIIPALISLLSGIILSNTRFRKIP